MADCRRLYDPAVHFGFRVVPGILFAMMAVAVYGMLRDGAEAWIGLVGAAIPVAGVLALGATCWRTRPLFGSASHLLVGRGPRARQVPFAEVISLDRPWWAFNPVFAAHQITLRDGSQVLFFPSVDAEGFLRARAPEALSRS